MNGGCRGYTVRMRKGIEAVIAIALFALAAGFLWLVGTIGSHVLDGDNEIAEWLLA